MPKSPHNNPSRELADLVLFCARRFGTGEALVRKAREERVAPLLYFAFEECGWPDDLSRDTRRALEREYFLSAGASVALLHAADEATTALANVGVRATLFKGSALARDLYPNPALRPMSDVDLWVPPEQAAQSEAVLTRLGYEPFGPEIVPGLTRRVRHARLYVRRDGPSYVGLDLHWSLVGHETDRRATPLGWFQSETRDVPGGSFRRLSATAHLLYLAGHMKLQHFDEAIPLLWLIDFHLLLRSGDVDFDVLVDQANRCGWRGALAATARDVHDRLSVELAPPLARLVDDSTTADDWSESPGAPPAERVWNELRTLGWAERASLLRALLLPSLEYVRYRYRPEPAWSWPLAYPRRWAMMVTQAGAFAFRSASRKLHKKNPPRTPLLDVRISTNTREIL